MSDAGPPDLRSPAEEAARWFLRLQEGTAGPEAFVGWQRWLNAAPGNREAYASIEETVLLLGRHALVPKLPTAAEMAHDDYDGSLPVRDWKPAHARLQQPSTMRRPKASRERRSWSAAAATAGVAAVVLAAASMWHAQSRISAPQTLSYRTAPGERRVVKLPDDSVVTLDADTALEVRLSPAWRSLRLEHGEAFFRVSKNPNRPFVVSTSSTQVTAVGTAFDVRLSGDRTVLAVTEGKVQFVVPPQGTGSSGHPSALAERHSEPQLAARIAAGEAISYRDDGSLRILPSSEAPLATSWLEGRRQYLNEPLRYVLADIDRYTGQRIELVGDDVGELRFTGTLDPQNKDAWLRGLAVALPVTVERREDGTLAVSLRHGR